MRIGIDARPFSGARTGIWRYLANVLSEMVQLCEHEFFLYSNSPISAPPGIERSRKREGRSHLRRLGSLWRETEGFRLMTSDKLDLFWGPLHVLPLRLAKQVPSVVTIHDLAHLHVPQTLTFRNLAIQKLLMRSSVAAAHKVVSVSEATARDITSAFGVPPDRVAVIHPAASPQFEYRRSTTERTQALDRHRLQLPFFLAVGTVEPRKNLSTLVRAFRVLKGGETPAGLRLAIAGGKGWKNSSLYSEVAGLGLGDDVMFLGNVSDDELVSLYSACSAFLFPSLFEGFGIPVAEALACGAPVIASNTSAIPEAALGMATLVNPLDEHEIAREMKRALADPGDRVQRARSYREIAPSYRAAAVAHLEVFEGLLH